MNSDILPTDRAVEESDEGSLAIGWPSWRLEPMAGVLRMVTLVGPTDVTVLVLGRDRGGEGDGRAGAAPGVAAAGGRPS